MPTRVHSTHPPGVNFKLMGSKYNVLDVRVSEGFVKIEVTALYELVLYTPYFGPNTGSVWLLVLELRKRLLSLFILFT